MRLFIIFFIFFVQAFSIGLAQERGAWVEHSLGHDAEFGRHIRVGTNCLIYYSAVDSDTVLAFDIYSHQWHAHPFKPNGTSLNFFAGDDAAMLWNDSLLTLYDAIHSTFHDLKYEGKMIQYGTDLYNLPGNVASLSYIVTSKKVYIFDHDIETWYSYDYSVTDATGYSGNARSDYVLIAISNEHTGQIKLIAFSKIRGAFEEVTETNLKWKQMDHGFVCWAYEGIPESDYFFSLYSAEHGFLRTIKPNRLFEIFVNQNPPLAESTVFIADYYVPHQPDYTKGTTYIYAGDTRHSSYTTGSFESISSGNEGTAMHFRVTGFKVGLFVKKNLPGYETIDTWYDGDDNQFDAYRSSLNAYSPISIYNAGSTFFLGYNAEKLEFINTKLRHYILVNLPEVPEGYYHTMGNFVNADWGIVTCQEYQSTTFHLYSYNSRTDSLKTQLDVYNGYNAVIMKKLYFCCAFQEYNNPKHIRAYLPEFDAWVTLPLAPSGVWGTGEAYIYRYDPADGNFDIFNVQKNAHWQFPYGWQTTYDISKYFNSYDTYLLAYNTDNHYLAYSSFTQSVKEYEAEYHNAIYKKLGGAVCILQKSSEHYEVMAYNAKYNSFIPLHLSEEQGKAIEIKPGGSTALVITKHGSLFAFDPSLEATAIGNEPGENRTLPEQFYLKQNYPNPFNPSTTIKYQLAKKTKVELTVYNVLGEKVATLVKEKQLAGTYSISFNGARFSSGIYFYRLSSDNFSCVRKMILMR